ncbi:uncharacterized protein VNE69_01190 [Vairimorpha necatrix]|uniref:Uncharacterized protein n=1 Tax=Vairimorpha necatrix TaxID=6039 RepID=A0AAX4J8J0_9MICR
MNLFYFLSASYTTEISSITSIYNLLANNEIRNEVCDTIKYSIENSPYIIIDATKDNNQYALINIKSDLIEIKTYLFSKITYFKPSWSVKNYTEEICACMVDHLIKICCDILKGPTHVYVNVFAGENGERNNNSRKEKEEQFVKFLRKYPSCFTFHLFNDLLKSIILPNTRKFYWKSIERKIYIFPLISSFDIIENLIYKEESIRKITKEMFDDKTTNENVKINKYIRKFVEYIILRIAVDSGYANKFVKFLFYQEICKKYNNGLLSHMLYFMINCCGSINFLNSLPVLNSILKKKGVIGSKKLKNLEDIKNYLETAIHDFNAEKYGCKKNKKIEKLSRSVLQLYYEQLNNEFIRELQCILRVTIKEQALLVFKLSEYLDTLFNLVFTRARFYFNLANTIDKKQPMKAFRVEFDFDIQNYKNKAYQKDFAYMKEVLNDVKYPEKNFVKFSRTLIVFLYQICKRQ